MEFFFIAEAILVSLPVALASLFIYRKMPACWLCDHGESPGVRQQPGNRCPGAVAAVLAMWAGCSALVFLAGTLRCTLFCAFVILMPAVLCDLDYMIIPDQTCLAMLLLGGLYSLALEPARLLSMLGALTAVTLLMVLSMLFSKAASGSVGFGAGDLKLLAASGACVGAVSGDRWLDAAVVFFAGSILSGAVWFAIQIAGKRLRPCEARPMAPWIASSALAVLAMALRSAL